MNPPDEEQSNGTVDIAQGRSQEARSWGFHLLRDLLVVFGRSVDLTLTRQKGILHVCFTSGSRLVVALWFMTLWVDLCYQVWVSL